MNIVSVTVGMALMGAAAPAVMNMSISPIVAQVRARNFSTAETAAVTFAANWEGAKNPDWGKDVPDNCTEPVATGSGAYDITCSGGTETSQYRQEVTRSFRLAPANAGGYTNPTRSFAFETPTRYSHVECLPNDPWGVMWYNDHLKAGNLDACIPAPVWSRDRYLESNPDDWLYDLSDHGYGQHPDY